MVKVMIQDVGGTGVVHSTDGSNTTCGIDIRERDVYDGTEEIIKKYCDKENARICDSCQIKEITKWNI